jgi:hypothetical protein
MPAIRERRPFFSRHGSRRAVPTRNILIGCPSNGKPCWTPHSDLFAEILSARSPRRRSPTRKTRGSIPCDPTKACSQERPLRGHAVGRHFSLPEEQSLRFQHSGVRANFRANLAPQRARAPRRRACLRRGTLSLFAASSRRTATTCLPASQNGFSVTSRAEPTRILE